MAQQDEGWPLGLQPLNVRVGLARNRDLSGSVSFNTILTASPPSSSPDSSSSDLDTESTGSFFPDKSITLGSLIGISSILELSRRSTRGKSNEALRDHKKCNKSKARFFSLCSKLSTDAVSMNTTSSLGRFLEAERKNATTCKKTPTTSVFGPDDFSEAPVSRPNSLFVGGEVAPPPQQPRPNPAGLLEHGDEDGAPFPLSCLCRQLTH